MNPYKVLGVSENASPEEIRSAYLALVKKYHPDKYTDSDLKDLATEKLQEINEAYDMITKNNNRGSNASSSYGSHSSSYTGAYAQEFARVRYFINQGNLQEAQRLLDSINEHNAEWNYLYGIICFRQGWQDRAAHYFETAHRMAPNNMEYSTAYNSVFTSGGFNRSGNRNYSDDSYGGCSTCDLCSSLLCADCCCEMMGGDLIRCC